MQLNVNVNAKLVKEIPLPKVFVNLLKCFYSTFI